MNWLTNLRATCRYTGGSLLLTLLVSTCAVGETPCIDVKAVDAAVLAARRDWSAPGAAVVIVKDGKVVLLKGYGWKSLKKDAPVTPDTLFPLASCSKAFTSAALAKLVDDGTLQWDDPVRKHLPSFHLSDEHADRLVTLRDLLTHRSGLGGHDLLWYRASWNLDETLRRVPNLPLTAPFRGGYQYTSLGFLAAGAAAANRTDREWCDLVRDAIGTPLGLRSLAFTTAEAAKNPDRAAGHRLRPDGTIEAMPELDMKEPNPAGSIFASPRDLGEWVKFHLNDGTVHGKQIISAKQLAETREPHTPMRREGAIKSVYPLSHQVSYAMGWVVYDHRGEKVVAHGGVIDGFRVQVTLLPERKIGFAMLNNLHETKMNIALGNTLIDLMCGLPAKDWNAYYRQVDTAEAAEKAADKARRNRERQADEKPTLSLDKYVGEYQQDAYGTGKVTLTDGRITWAWSSFRLPLEHWQGDTFRVTSGFFADELVRFTATSDGVTAVTVRGIDFRKR